MMPNVGRRDSRGGACEFSNSLGASLASYSRTRPPDNSALPYHLGRGLEAASYNTGLKSAWNCYPAMRVRVLGREARLII